MDKKRVLIILLWVVVIAFLFVVFRYFDPTHSKWAPKCPFWLLTGYECPGCGSQRAIHCFVNGHFWEGIQHNYILLPSLFYVMALSFFPRKGKIHSVLSSSTACWIWLGVIMVWWVGRNIIGC
ncbi:MAG: DUF2752 domain-containing protein [Bacteroidales bacterium]|nr:DUF2752 domain-containing protein [Bacteroidales bacterium]